VIIAKTFFKLSLFLLKFGSLRSDTLIDGGQQMFEFTSHAAKRSATLLSGRDNRLRLLNDQRSKF